MAKSIVVVLFLILLILPYHYEYCYNDSHTNYKNCSSYQLFYYICIKGFNLLNEYNSVVTALAGAVVALFTGTLWWVTKGSVAAAAVAADAANESAKTANRAFEHAQDTFILGNRAYIVADPINIIPTTKLDARGNIIEILGWSIQVSWKNRGQTPAIRVRTAVNFCAGTGQLPTNYSFQDIDGGTPGENPVVGPGMYLMTSPVTLKKEQIERILKENMRLYLWSWVEYNDILGPGERRRTEYCVEVRLLQNPLTLPLRAEEAWGFVGYGPFNGMDEYSHHKPKTTG